MQQIGLLVTPGRIATLNKCPPLRKAIAQSLRVDIYIFKIRVKKMYEYTIQEVNISEVDKKGNPILDKKGNPVLVKAFVGFTHVGSTTAQKTFSLAATAARHLIRGAQ